MITSKTFTLLRIAALAVLVVIIAWVEANHSPGYFRLISFALVFLMVADIASLLRGAARGGLIVLASLIFGLCVIEASAIVLEPKQDIVSTAGWSARRPVVGWGPKHAGRFHSEKADPKTGAIIYSADYTIDANLMRGTRSVGTRPTIAFFGDSMTFGQGLNDADTLPQRFADSLEPKERVINAGFPGYGPQQFLRELETGVVDAAIGPDPKLFIFLTSPFQVERTACKASWVINSPRYLLENGKVAFKGACFEGLALQLQEFLWHTAAYRMILAPYRQQIRHDDVELYIRILLAAVDLAKEKYGVPTLIPFIADAHAYLRGTGFTNEAIVDRLRRGGARVIDVSLANEEAAGATISIPRDGHPTAIANRMRAQQLKDYIQQDMAGVLYSQLN